MPCYDDRDGKEETYSKEDFAAMLKQFHHNSPLAELMCSAMEALKANHLIGYVNDDVRAWWEEHQDIDRERKESYEQT